MLSQSDRRRHVSQLLADKLVLEPPELVEALFKVRERLTGAR
jgi:hypothetical protein